MKPPLGSLVLAAVAAVFGGLVLIERGPQLLHGAPDTEAAGLAVANSLPAGPQPRWVVEPTQTDPNLPPTGRSLFDFVMAKSVGGKPAYEIPYPFDALVRKVEAQAGCAPGACVKQVLIPLGRSLQRTAAAPDFFAYPRVVVAVDGEGSSGMLLKDRLYIGYQEKSDLLEVISYNELAGRFEFEVVKDYRAGVAPRVVYASRTVCAACHQNLAPLFSRQQWDETNANPAVATRLAAAKGNFYGFPAHRGMETPNAIDGAVHRANMLAVYQTLWGTACGDDAQRSAACRRALLTAAVQFRLSGDRAFDANDPGVRDGVATEVAKALAARWPNGMALPNSEIPNRDPFNYRDGAIGLAMTEVAARLEPLAPRGPLEVWAADGTQMVNRMVAGLAQIFSEQDMKLLDDELAKAAQNGRAPSHNIAAHCSVSGSEADIRFQCAGNDANALTLEGRVTLRGAHTESGELAILALKNEQPLRLINISGGELSRADKANLLIMVPAIDGRRARLGSGNAVERVELRWQGDDGEVAIRVSEDFAPLRQAIAAMASDHPLLSAKPLARANVMAALAPALGLAQRPWCCVQTAALPAAEEDVDAGTQLPPLAEPFKKACGACHGTPERSPPNFLHGDAQRISAAFNSCAPRMFVRLSMWSTAPDKRAKVPMPPPRAEHDGMPLDQEYGPKPEVLEMLKAAAADIVRRQSGAEPDLQRMLEDGYENLHPCLPAGT